MKIAIVGPTHPYKGGIAQHTTGLAHQLQAAGHEVTLVSWRTQYPFFYPGIQFVPEDKPEVPVFENTKRVLSWKQPLGWAQWARKLKKFDQVIFVWWVPTIQGPVYSTMLRVLGRYVRTTVICHNVSPHEGKPGDKLLTQSVLRRADEVMVHTEAQATIAKQLGVAKPRVATMPLVAASKPQGRRQPSHELLFFGFIRSYKGVDVLLKAVARVPTAKLTIAGDFWGGADEYEALVTKLKLEDRVTIHNGYLDSSDLAEHIWNADAVVLPYKSGTATWNAKLAHLYGTPVIATTASSLATQVHDGIDGLLCKPDDVDSLAAAIKDFYRPGTAERLRAGVTPPPTTTDWERYIQTLLKH
jgi:glycosyltransferase involved in cell wall biosynthesis